MLAPIAFKIRAMVAMATESPFVTLARTLLRVGAFRENVRALYPRLIVKGAVRVAWARVVRFGVHLPPFTRVSLIATPGEPRPYHAAPSKSITR